MGDREVRAGGGTRKPATSVHRFGPWIGIGLVGSVLRPGTTPPPPAGGPRQAEAEVATA